MAPSGLLVGLDIGGTKTEALVVDRELQVRSRVIGQTIIADPEQLLASVNNIIYQALEEGGA
jgi:N-acetylglucosamine kinase-like BadF-type ATPase